MADPAERERLLARLIEVASWDRAIEVATDLIADEPTNPKWHRAAGQCALHRDDAETAEHHLTEALRADPGDDLAHYFMSHAMRLAKRPVEAEEAVQSAIKIEPTEADYWTELGWLSFERDDHGAALRCGKRACGLAPDNSRAATLLAAAESQVPAGDGGTRSDPEAQIASLQRALEIDPSNDAALHNIGVVYFNELRDYRAAERHFRHALSISPSEELYQRNLARSLRRQDPITRALYAPWHFVSDLFDMVARGWEKRWPLLLALPILPFLFGGTLLILLFWVIFLWPPATFYEFITRPETMAAAGRLAPRSNRRTPLNWPRTARLTLFLAVFTIFWLVLILLFRALAFRAVIANLLIGLVAAWLAIAAFACIREFIASRERRARGSAIDLLER